MQRLRRLFLTLAILFAVFQAGIAAAQPVGPLFITNNWSDATHLSVPQSAAGPDSGQFPVTLVDGNGVVVSLWRTDIGTTSSDTTYQVWYNLRLDGAWQDAEPIADLPSPYDAGSYSGAGYFNAVKLSNGNLLAVAVMTDSGSSTVQFFSSVWNKDTRSWSDYAPANASTEIYDGYAFPVATADGAMLVFTMGNADEGTVHWMRYDAASDSWGDIQRSDTLTDMVVEYITPVYDRVHDTVYLTTFHDDEILYSGAIFPDDTTSPRWEIVNPAYGYYSDPDQFHTAAFIDGDAIVVWAIEDEDVFYSILTADGPSAPTTIPGFPPAGTMPTVAVDPLGRVVVTIDDGNDVVYVNYSSARPDQGGTWQSSALALHSGSDVDPANFDATLALSPAGYLVMTYFTRTATEDHVNLRVLLRTGWSEEYVIDTTTSQSATIQYSMFAIDQLGRPSITWTNAPDYGAGFVQGVYGANFFDAIVPTDSLSSTNADTRVVPECLTMPDIEVVQQAELAAGGSTTLKVTFRNQHNQTQGVSDVLLSLSDGIAVSDASSGVLNLGQRAALQGIVLAPNETRSFDVTVSAGDNVAPAPIFVAEIYCGGRVLGSVSGPFGGPISAGSAAAAPVAEAPAVAAPAAEAPAAEVPTLPISLPNTAGTALPLAGIVLAAAAAIAVGRRLRG
jgi:hypothetical protein